MTEGTPATPETPHDVSTSTGEPPDVSAAPTEQATGCALFNRGACRSCTQLPLPYDEQVRVKQAACARLLAPRVRPEVWRPAQPSEPWGFRNTAKLSATGPKGAVRLTGPGHAAAGDDPADLTQCPLYTPDLASALPVIGEALNAWGLTPYQIGTRTGELKGALVTASPAGRLMARFVLRSPGQRRRITGGVGDLVSALPALDVATINYQPEHTTALTGTEEEHLTADDALTMTLPDAQLYLAPGAFWQTNTSVAAALYSAVADEVSAEQPGTIADLFCGVGGFALHVAARATDDWEPDIVGTEIAASAIACANRAATHLAHAPRFCRTDARAITPPAAETVIVNPPRRGLGPALCATLTASPARTLVYSSCNPETIARDLDQLTAFTPVSAQLFDMFPGTEHAEVLVVARR